tara:strand:- start:6004 stop:6573 length:570 start_codon:yes stop_codon:yes gene_type:complete
MTIEQLIKKDIDNHVKDNYNGTYTIKVKAISKDAVRPFQQATYRITECSVCGDTCPQRLNALNNKRAYCTKKCQEYMQKHMNKRKVYKDGWRVKSNGYVMKRMWDDRYNGEWVYKHRYVMEQHLGRKLRKDEFVHHIDCVKTNNNINNLWLCNASNHALAHKSVEKLFPILIQNGGKLSFNTDKGIYYL